MKKYECPNCNYTWSVNIGRPRSVDYGWIGTLRKQGLKVKDICKITGYSMGAVARGIKDSNLEGIRKRGQR